MPRSSRSKKIVWQKDTKVAKRVVFLAKFLKMNWVKEKRIYGFRSFNSKSRAIARIWGLSKIWQDALEIEPAYIVEIIAERFDKLNEKKKDEVLLHELAHIPKNFSGALVPHTRRRKGSFHDKLESFLRSYYQKR